MTEQTFAVTGLTCDHCVHAVTTEVAALPGVRTVAVDLQAGGTSTLHVTAESPVEESRVAEALDEAGDYRLA
jgi:copper chaperone CopZ